MNWSLRTMSFVTIFSIICFSFCINNGIGINVGDEESLRQNIAQLLGRKFRFSSPFSYLPSDENELDDETPENDSEYDFIVIGAGSAGSAITSRLTEIPNFSVLLIEAGDKEYSVMDIPSMAESLVMHPDVDWSYMTEPSDRYCLGMKDRKCLWPRGKVMGGSSTINGMNARRGNWRDYEAWANEVGDETWSSKNMLKYFKKLENNEVNGVPTDGRLHNKGGPMIISDLPVRAPLAETFIEAAEELGYPHVNWNGPEQIGFTFAQTTTFQGERWSANRGYLWPAKGRSNLHLTRNSQVMKILIDEPTKCAYGVRYMKNGQVFEVRAKREVILSAGTVNSPQILMLSGIGPAQHLQELGINVIKDSPVGENLFDHVAYTRDVTFSVSDNSVIQNPDVLDYNDPSISDYINYRNGSLSYGVGLNVVGYVNVDDYNNLRPDIEMIISPGGGIIRPKTNTPSNTFSVSTLILRPRSRGRILLRSQDPLDKPKIYPNILDDPDDVRVLTKGIRLAMRLGETNALKRRGAQYSHTQSPCDSLGVGSDQYWECEMRYFAISFQHPSGTCKMGRVDDSRSVVDSRLRVIGVAHLRVVDASVIPSPICAHLNIPAIAIGEKGADFIKEEYGQLFTLNGPY